MWTYRIKYAKLGLIRFISHLDLMRAITRAISCADVPVAYTEGFNPHPKISMGPALPLGYESTCELVDITLSNMLSAEDLQKKLAAAMPKGLSLLEAERVLDSFPPLSSASSACYMIELSEGTIPDNADKNVREFLAKQSAPVERVRKDTSTIVDVKQFVMDLGIETRADSRWLRVEISVGGQGSCSASEVAQAVLNLSPENAKCLRIIRTDIKFEGRPTRVRLNEKAQEEEAEKRQ